MAGSKRLVIEVDDRARVLPRPDVLALVEVHLVRRVAAGVALHAFVLEVARVHAEQGDARVDALEERRRRELAARL